MSRSISDCYRWTKTGAANSPTFPQIYINGELIGGCDITLELYQKGELQKMVKEASAAKKAS